MGHELGARNDAIDGRRRHGLEASWTTEGAPLDGPADRDTGLAEFANRLAAIARFAPRDASGLAQASEAILKAARLSFGFVNPWDPRHIVWPVQLALSLGAC